MIRGMFTLVLEIARDEGAERSGAEAGLSAFDRSPAAPELPMPVDTAEFPYVSSAEAALSVA